jgi:hypothetical protein
MRCTLDVDILAEACRFWKAHDIRFMLLVESVSAESFRSRIQFLQKNKKCQINAGVCSSHFWRDQH